MTRLIFFLVVFLLFLSNIPIFNVNAVDISDYVDVIEVYEGLTEFRIVFGVDKSILNLYVSNLNLNDLNYDLVFGYGESNFTNRFLNSSLSLIENSTSYIFTYKLNCLPSTDGFLVDVIPSIRGYTVDCLAWWSSSWNKRIDSVISNPYEDYVVYHRLFYDSDMQSDFDDIRFIGDSCDELYFWLENKTDSSSCDYWINISDSTNISIYYSHPTCSQSSYMDGDNTFFFFDHFTGSSLDSNKWDVVSGGLDVGGSNLYVNGTSGTRGLIEAKSVYAFGIDYEYRVYAIWNSVVQGSQRYVGMRPSGDFTNRTCTVTSIDASKVICRSYEDNVYEDDVKRTIGLGTVWTDYIIRRVQGTSNVFLYNSTTMVTHSTYVNSYDSELFFYEGNTNGNVISVDWCFVRPYNTTESSFSFGGEITNTLPTATNPNPSNKSTGVSLSIGSWNVTIQDKHTSFNYTLECTDGSTTSASNQSNGSKTLTLTNPLVCNTNYTVYVNISEYCWECPSVGESVNYTFWFVTVGCPSCNCLLSNENISNATTNVNTSLGFYNFTVAYNISCANFTNAYINISVLNMSRNVSISSNGTSYLNYTYNFTCNQNISWYVNLTSANCSNFSIFWFITEACTGGVSCCDCFNDSCFTSQLETWLQNNNYVKEEDTIILDIDTNLVMLVIWCLLALLVIRTKSALESLLLSIGFVAISIAMISIDIYQGIFFIVISFTISSISVIRIVNKVT